MLLPEHIHSIWHLPESDRDYSRRWSIVKRRFTQEYREGGYGKPPFWQKRFWAHRIDDDLDYEHHMNYIHYNPVKHGYVSRAKLWPWTSFHRYVEQGVYPVDWGEGVIIPAEIGRE